MTAKFDPVAWYVANIHRFGLGREGYNDMFRALAAEAAKQQARRDAEICRARIDEQYGPNTWAYRPLTAEECAQAIEREAELV